MSQSKTALTPVHVSSNESSKAPARTSEGRNLVQRLAELPEEELWLQGLRSRETRRAYRLDVRDFIETLGIQSRDDLRAVDRGAIVYWRDAMADAGVWPRTIRRRLSALSSLFTHLVTHQLAERNPVRDVMRPRINRRTGTTASFSQQQARALLDAPPTDTVVGLRDRAILSIGLQVGPRRAEIAHLTVRDLHQTEGLWALRFTLKGGTDNTVAVNSQTAQRIHDYLKAAGHHEDREGPLFRPVRGNSYAKDSRRHLHPDTIDRVVRKWVRVALGSTHGFSAHSMRATFITTALKNGANLENVQRDVGHADPSTTKLYDRRGHSAEESTSFFANY